MDYQVAAEMQAICTGERRSLTRGQIASEVIDLKKATKGFKPEMVEKCTEFYNRLISDNETKLYDVDMLMDESEAVKSEFERFIRDNRGNDMFRALYDDIGEFFKVPPFEGLDNVEYGVHEVCVFSVLEYFAWKLMQGYDHEGCRAEYRDSIADRTYDEVADKWIKVYDDLQRRYEEFVYDMEEDISLRKKLTCCCIVAVAAIRDQDQFSLDMVQSGAEKKAEKIVASRIDDTYREGESDFTDNVVRLFDFVFAHVRDFNRKQ